ncbi:hypothetical protein ES703_40585 [subsurface metagenome]
MPKIPRLPKLTRPLEPLREIIRGGRERLEEAGSDIHSIAEDLRGNIPSTSSTIQEAEKAPEIKPQSRTAGPTAGASDKDTLLYQLDHLVAVLTQLEVHLSEGCKIMGAPCDCCGKHALQARTFAMETIPIAARMDKDTLIYQDIASWTPYIEEIDTPEKVESGDYDETYRKESGTASKFRKKIQSMLGELKGDNDCPGCEEMRETISSFIERRKKK